MEIRANANKTHEVRNQNVRGIFLTLVVESDAVATDLLTAFADVILDPSRVILDVDLYQKNKHVKMVSGQLGPLHMESNPDNKMNALGASQGWFQVLNDLPFVAATATTNSRYEIPFYIDFGHVINLDGEDLMKVRLNFPSSALDPAVNVNTAYFQLEMEQAIGVQTIIPTVQIRSLSGDDGTVTEPLGDNVTDLMYINTEGGSDNIAGRDRLSRFIESYTLNSDRYNDHLTRETIYAQAFRNSSAEGPITRIHPSIQLFSSETEIDEARIRIVFDTTLLNPGVNFLVWRSFKTCPEITAKASGLKKKHASKNYKKAISA